MVQFCVPSVGEGARARCNVFLTFIRSSDVESLPISRDQAVFHEFLSFTNAFLSSSSFSSLSIEYRIFDKLARVDLELLVNGR